MLGERIQLLKKMGFADNEIRELIWAKVGQPLAHFGSHQDSKFIGGAE